MKTTVPARVHHYRNGLRAATLNPGDPRDVYRMACVALTRDTQTETERAYLVGLAHGAARMGGNR